MSKDAMDELVRDAYAALNGHFEELKHKAAELEDELVYAHANREDAEQREREAVAERDALAAHVEQIREAFMPGTDGTDGGRLLAIGYVLNQSPATSLALLIAEKQAEALGQLYNERQGEGMVRRGLLLDRAIELREEAAEMRRQGGEASQ